MDRFDREFFGISESDVTFMDPQERLLLESTYEAIVDAGENIKVCYFSQ
jgi:epothilone polyketide synthase D